MESVLTAIGDGLPASSSADEVQVVGVEVVTCPRLQLPRLDALLDDLIDFEACTHFRKGADDVYIASDPTTTATDTTAAHRIPTTSSHSELKMYLSHLAALNAVSQYLHVAAD
uniref:Uncharacterized protein n=1 Tax=Peronospora matthiolae TaxID=2874970 RepID=A0AAV1TMG1_9STRA